MLTPGALVPASMCPLSVCLCVQLCTLSASGGDLLNAFPPGAAPLFDVVVVDEAAQALEPATLIPFQLIKPGAPACCQQLRPRVAQAALPAGA